ncbi:MAG: hypothetical protein ACYC91_01325 [Solirubrobacteraceae bacterium]
MATSEPGAEARVSAPEPGPLIRASAWLRDNTFRLERRIAKRYFDVELRQLRSLQRAYGGHPGPEVLMFGDSQLFWTIHTDTDRRHVVQMVRDELGGELQFEALLGPAYNPRIVMAYMTAFTRLSARPRVVVVPTSLVMSASTWLSHPVFGWEQVSDGIRAAIAHGGRLPRRLQRPGPEAEDAYDRLPAPSLFGARRTLGELRLITNAKPTTRWQQVIRLRHLVDYYYAERLEPGSIGLTLTTEVAAMLSSMGLQSVAYIPPINYEVVRKALGDAAHEHIVRNAELVERAYRDGAGDRGIVVNAAFDSPAAEYLDPLHLKEEGRRRFASRLAAAIDPLLAQPSSIQNP